MATKKLERVFMHGKIELQDPDSSISIERVKDIYSNRYPELVNAKFNGPKIKDGKAVYTFDSNVGTNG